MAITTQIDNIDFVNSVQKILEEFILTYYSNCYVTFDYDGVETSFEKINNNEIINKPVIHIWLDDIGESPETSVGNDISGKKFYFIYSVFVIVNEELKTNNNNKSKFVLNEISSELKHIFDINRIELYMFDNVQMSHSKTDMMGKNPDGLYAHQHELRFKIVKQL